MSGRILLALVVCCAGLRAQVTIVNGASFRGDQPVAAGSWAAAFGSFSGVSATTASSFPLPKTLGGVTVSINVVNAPLFDVRATQLTFLIPNATTPGRHPVQITTSSGTISGFVRVMTAAPGLFVKDNQTPPSGAVLNNGVTANTSSAPARPGDVISIYGTGPGAFDQTVNDGAAPGANPLIRTKSTPQVLIGGVPAQVQFSGLNPDAPGLWQINAVVPNQSYLKGRIPVMVFMDGVDSNQVSIFVQ